MEKFLKTFIAWSPIFLTFPLEIVEFCPGNENVSDWSDRSKEVETLHKSMGDK